jgi:hypothetical protein
LMPDFFVPDYAPYVPAPASLKAMG